MPAPPEIARRVLQAAEARPPCSGPAVGRCGSDDISPCRRRLASVRRTERPETDTAVRRAGPHPALGRTYWPSGFAACVLRTRRFCRFICVTGAGVSACSSGAPRSGGGIGGVWPGQASGNKRQAVLEGVWASAGTRHTTANRLERPRQGRKRFKDMTRSLWTKRPHDGIGDVGLEAAVAPYRTELPPPLAAQGLSVPTNLPSRAVETGDAIR